MSKTVWCEECAEEGTAVICSATDERTCAACHEWVGCPCQDEDSWFLLLSEIAYTDMNGRPVTVAETMWG
jgi:hypothetical protein